MEHMQISWKSCSEIISGLEDESWDPVLRQGIGKRLMALAIKWVGLVKT